MKVKIVIIAALVFGIPLNLKAQDQKTLLTQWGSIPLTCFGNNCNTSAKYKLTLNNWDDPYMWHATIGNQFKNQSQDFYAIPDQKPYPIFLTTGNDWGDDRMQYFKDFTVSGDRLQNSILIVNGMLYEVEQQKDKSWKVKYIYTKEKYNILKRFKKEKELAQIDHDKVVNDFIKAQQKELTAKTAAYKKQHAAYYQTFEKELGWVKQDLKEANAYRSKLAAEYAKNKGGCSRVTLVNSSSRTIYVATSGSNNPGTEIKPGSKTTWSCAYDGYIQTKTKKGCCEYVYKTTTTKVYTANSGCGKTVNLN